MLDEYKFRYSLSALPEIGSLIVKPYIVMKRGGGSAISTMSFIPKSTVFQSNSTDSTGYFYINLTSTMSSEYNISFQLSGPSSYQYDSRTYITVLILASDRKPPPPSVSSTIFADSGGHIMVFFNSPTDFANITRPVVVDNICKIGRRVEEDHNMTPAICKNSSGY